jgi:hypothetical protein
MLPTLPALALLLVASQQTPARATNAFDGVQGLAFLLGDWRSHESTKSADGKVIPFDLQGKNAWILEGQYLQIDEGFEVEGQGRFANQILLTFDNAAQKYRAWWFTNRSPQPIVFSGERTEKTLVLTQDAGRIRIAYDLLEDGHYKASVQVKRGETWETQTTAEYHRSHK